MPKPKDVFSIKDIDRIFEGAEGDPKLQRYIRDAAKSGKRINQYSRHGLKKLR